MNRFISSVLAAVIGLLLLAKYSYPHFTATREEHQNLSVQVATLQAEAAKLPAARERNAALKAELTSFQAQLPNDEELPAVLSNINTLAAELQVSAGRLTRTVTTSKVPGVSAVNLNLELTGSYARIQALVQSMARLKRAYTATNIRIAAAEVPGQVTATLAFTTYKRDTTAPTATAPQTSTTSPVPASAQPSRDASPGEKP